MERGRTSNSEYNRQELQTGSVAEGANLRNENIYTLPARVLLQYYQFNPRDAFSRQKWGDLPVRSGMPRGNLDPIELLRPAKCRKRLRERR